MPTPADAAWQSLLRDGRLASPNGKGLITVTGPFREFAMGSPEIGTIEIDGHLIEDMTGPIAWSADSRWVALSVLRGRSLHLALYGRERRKLIVDQSPAGEWVVGPDGDGFFVEAHGRRRRIEPARFPPG